MTLLDYIKSADKTGSIIFSDEYNINSGFYVDINKLHMLENGEQIFEILSLFIEDYIDYPFCAPTGIAENIRYIDGKAFEFLSKTTLVIDEEVTAYNSWVRRPYFRMRGKRVTEQQAFEIIQRTDRFFDERLHIGKSINLLHFHNWWFNKDHFPTHYGWCHPSGIIGYNGITDKYPTIDELLNDMIEIKFAFPYLDFVIAITWWDEVHPDKHKWEETATKGIKDIKKYLDTIKKLAFTEYPDFLENIEIGIWVHEDTIEFMRPVRTKKIYQEYEAKYGEVNKNIYVPGYYTNYPFGDG